MNRETRESTGGELHCHNTDPKKELFYARWHGARALFCILGMIGFAGECWYHLRGRRQHLEARRVLLLQEGGFWR
jgi:hypothetical protein